MESLGPKRKSSCGAGDIPPYVSKEKYTALADEIRMWEDDLRHMLHRQPSSCPLVNAHDDASEATSTKKCGRESLEALTPAYVSSLRKFWEGLMTKESTPPVPDRKPLRVVQAVSSSPTVPESLVPTEVSVIDENAQIDSSSVENPELPPPPAALIDENSNDADTDLPPPPSLSCSTENVLSKSADFTESPDSPHREIYLPECPSTTQPVSHRYYSRPRMGASGHGVLRNWPNSSNLNHIPASPSPPLPRQRSVTFEPKRGCAPGDTETDTDVYEALDGGESPQQTQSNRYKDIDGKSFGILESAARLANSADRLNRHQRASVTPPFADSANVSSDSSSSSELPFSDDEGGLFSDGGINSEPQGPTGRLSSRSRRSSTCADGLRRISREASALLDFECPQTPTKKANRVSRGSVELASEAAAVRRLERIKELSDLIDQEKTLIMELSSSLTELHSKRSNSKPERSASASTPSAPGGEAGLVELNQNFLLACQRRQALMEELTLLHKGSPVLVPPMRGEPLRARLQLHSVRVALKPEPPLAPTPSIPGGYVLIGMGKSGVSATPYDSVPSPIDGGPPVKFHILAILRCLGEGRIYHTQTATLMRVADLPSGSARPTPFIDLLADIDIVPLRPDFVISIELYCLKTGGATDKHVSRSSVTKKSQTPTFADSPVASTKKCGGFHLPFTFSTLKRKKYNISSHALANDPSAAFALLSSVSLKHHDDLLFGRLPLSNRRSDGAGETPPTGMPLFLEGLPRSSPLAGPLGLNQVSVRLQSSVLKRGFLTVFDESGGMGVWTRCWCKLLADQLIYWRYPEDEDAVGVAPIGRVDLRHVVAPWAVEAPRKICVRANTIYMRSLIAVNPKWLLDGEKSSASSILLHASSDYKWLEQRHLICADTWSEMESWLKLINKSLEVIQRWMPEHFACLARYDSKLVFSELVSANVASRLKLQANSSNQTSDSPP
uniref:PH domain-containing protein n=2 Tax=Mesocestoides corti TaxID=53468 RepID=A0A5K3F6I8_MESCO